MRLSEMIQQPKPRRAKGDQLIRTPLGKIWTQPFLPVRLMKEVLEMKGLLKMMVRTLRSIDMGLPSQRDWSKLRKTPITDVSGPMSSGPSGY